jgi:ribosomal protein S18 acetylase RimI-like enzyme
MILEDSRVRGGTPRNQTRRDPSRFESRQGHNLSSEGKKASEATRRLFLCRPRAVTARNRTGRCGIGSDTGSPANGPLRSPQPAASDPRLPVSNGWNTREEEEEVPRIRPYRAEDWESYLALDVETGLASLHSPTADEQEKFRANWAVVLKTRFGWNNAGPSKDKGVLHVLESDDGAYAGFLWLSEQADLFSGVPKLFVTTVAVASQYRGRGWGRLLMESALADARVRGFPSVALGVDARNEAARKLYADLGFNVTRVTMELRLP